MSVDFIPGTFLDANVRTGMSSQLEMRVDTFYTQLKVFIPASKTTYTQVLGDLNVAPSVSRAQGFESTNHIQTSHLTTIGKLHRSKEFNCSQLAGGASTQTGSKKDTKIS